MRGPSLVLLSLLAVNACGDLPQPFRGNPGVNGRILAEPPVPRLAIPLPKASLPDAGSRALATDLAKALQSQQVPAVAAKPGRTDWRLIATASQRGSTVVPLFTVLDSRGKDRGKTETAPVPTAAWAAAAPATLNKSAAEAAPKIAALLNDVETTRQMADTNGPDDHRARVMVADVQGAPGDGNVALTREMRTRLRALGSNVQTTTNDADFTVQGKVRMVPMPGKQERVEIQWIVKDAKGSERGRAVQLNAIPAGSLDHYWGDVASVVAIEASGGVNDVLKKQTAPPPAVTAVGEQQVEVAEPTRRFVETPHEDRRLLRQPHAHRRRAHPHHCCHRRFVRGASHSHRRRFVDRSRRRERHEDATPDIRAGE